MLELLDHCRLCPRRCGINYVYIGNTSLPGAEDTRCPRCGATLIRRSGYSVEPSGFGGVCPRCGQKIAGRFGW